MLHQDNLDDRVVIDAPPASLEGAIKDPAAPCQGASMDWYCSLTFVPSVKTLKERSRDSIH